MPPRTARDRGEGLKQSTEFTRNKSEQASDIKAPPLMRRNSMALKLPLLLVLADAAQLPLLPHSGEGRAGVDQGAVRDVRRRGARHISNFWTSTFSAPSFSATAPSRPGFTLSSLT